MTPHRGFYVFTDKQDMRFCVPSKPEAKRLCDHLTRMGYATYFISVRACWHFRHAARNRVAP